VEDIRNKNEVEAEEDLVEVVDRLFSIIVGHYGTMHGIFRVRHARLINNAASLTTLSKNALC